MNTIKDETTERMQKCMDSLSNQFNKIRTGRANPSICLLYTSDAADE